MRFALFALVLAACSDRVEVGYNQPAGGGTGEVGGGTGAESASGGRDGVTLAGNSSLAGTSSTPLECVRVACYGKYTACGNCEDDDEDGLIDAADPECLGPCDDNEASFGRAGSEFTPSCKLNCYFTSRGNDGCSWNRACDPASMPTNGASCAYAPDGKIMGNSTCAELEETHSACAEACLPLTPNGCDCYGCCELPAGSGRTVFLGSKRDGEECSLERLDACEPCTQVPACRNECDDCEVCLGKPQPNAGCPGGTPECPGGLPACGAEADCGEGAYCITGCCVNVPR